jgi:hypothetical protein
MQNPTGYHRLEDDLYHMPSSENQLPFFSSTSASRQSRSVIQDANTKTIPRASTHELRSLYLPNLFKAMGGDKYAEHPSTNTMDLDMPESPIYL